MAKRARIFVDSVSFIDISTFRVEGMDVTVTPGWDYQPCDVAVMYGLENPPRKSPQGRLRNAIHQQHTGPLIVIESSLIGRRFKARRSFLSCFRKYPPRPRQIHPYYRVAVGGALGDDADFGAKASPPDRWQRLQAELGIRLKPYRNAGDHVLLIGQTPRDASLRGVDIIEWLQTTASTLRGLTNRPILIRLHPGTRRHDRHQAEEACSGIPGVTISPIGRSLSDDLKGSWVCVTLSSGAAIDALIAGVPPICLSPASLAHSICSTDLSDLEHPKEPPREQFLCDLAYSQWSPKEFSDGTAWRHIKPIVTHHLDRSPTPERRDLPAVASSWEDAMPSLGPTARGLRLSMRKHWIKVAWLLPGRARYLSRQGKSLFKRDRFREAALLFDALRKRQPHRAKWHEWFARSAERSGDREGALSAWTTAGRISPHQIAPAAGRGRVLLQLHRLDEAEAIFRDLDDSHPSSKDGLRGLERVAEQRQDWPAVLAIQSRIWDRFGDPDALRRKVLLLLRLRREAEAVRLVGTLEASGDPLATLLATLPLLEATHEWATLIRLMQAHKPLVEGNWQLLSSCTQALSRLGRPDEALEMLQAGSAGTPSNRERLRIGVLIRANRYDEADTILEGLWKRKDLGGITAELLSPITLAAWEKGGQNLASSILDRIEKNATRDGSDQALRISIRFQRERLRHLSDLASAVPATPDKTIERHVGALVRESASPAPSASLFEEACERYAGLRTSCSAFFPDPSFVLTDALEITLRISKAFEKGQPLSLIRLGDGEGSLLPYREDLMPFQESDQKRTRYTWWGQTDQSPSDLESLAAQLAAAIRSADIIGMPDLERIGRGLLNSSPTAITDSGRNARGLLAAVDFIMGSREHDNPAALTSCHIHQAFAFWGIWELLFSKFGKVSLVTCHSRLPKIISEKFSVDVDDLHLIPPEEKYAVTFGDVINEVHYPDAFENIKRRIVSKDLSGQVTLVAAGILGKIYCHWISQAGGIALDIGSAADFWCGHETRSIPDISTYRSARGVPEQVRAVVENDPHFARILHERLRPDPRPRGRI